MPVCMAGEELGVGPRVTFSSMSGDDCAQSSTDREPAGRTDKQTDTDRQVLIRVRQETEL